MIEFILSNLKWFWLAILIVAIVIESFTMALTTVWAAIAALPMIFISLTPLPFKWQLLIFAVLTLLLAVFTRPFAVKKLKIGKEDKSNVAEIVGQEVLVVKAISGFQKGEVKTKNGVVWSAQSSEGKEIAEGAVCKVTSVEGNTLFIEGV